jgi:hypothetical protein
LRKHRITGYLARQTYPTNFVGIDFEPVFNFKSPFWDICQGHELAGTEFSNADEKADEKLES